MQSLVRPFLTAVNRTLIEPCFVLNETYAERTRKFAVLSLALMAFNAIFLGIPLLVISETYNPSKWSRLTTALLLQTSITGAVIPYLYMRLTRRLPQWLIDLQVWTSVPCIACVILFAPQAPCGVLATVSAYASIILRVRLWGLLVFIGVSLYVVSALLVQFYEDIPQLRDAIYTPHTLSERILYTCGGAVCPVIYFALGLHVIMQQFVQRSCEADFAIEMNLAVADKLLAYDTEGVAAILAANKGKVDDKLHQAFAGIQRNLEDFRPHIPDYVIAAAIGESTGPDEEDVVDDDDDERSLSLATSGDTLDHHSSGKKRSLRDLEITSSASPPRPPPPHHVPSNTFHRVLSNPPLTSDSEMSLGDASSLATSVNNAALFVEAQEACPGRTAGSVARIRSKSSSGGRRRGDKTQRYGSQYHHCDDGAASSLAGGTKHYAGRATTVFIRLVSAEFGSLHHTDGALPKGAVVPSVVAELNRAVEATVFLSKVHKGALQYMQGCGLMISFNAASRVAAHESKACAFALDVKAAIEELRLPGGSSLVVHVSVVTTNVLAFFAGNRGQLLLTVLGGYMPIHTAMHHFMSNVVGDNLSCLLISKGTLANTEHYFEVRSLGAVCIHTQHVDPTPADCIDGDASQLSTSKRTSQQNCGDAPLTLGISSSSNTVQQRIDMYQLIAAHKRSANDEWMYELSCTKNSHDITRQIVDMALFGDIRLAVELAAEHHLPMMGPSSDPILTKCIGDRLSRCQTQQHATFAENAPPATKMW